MAQHSVRAAAGSQGRADRASSTQQPASWHFLSPHASENNAAKLQLHHKRTHQRTQAPCSQCCRRGQGAHSLEEYPPVHANHPQAAQVGPRGQARQAVVVCACGRQAREAALPDCAAGRRGVPETKCSQAELVYSTDIQLAGPAPPQVTCSAALAASHSQPSAHRGTAPAATPALSVPLGRPAGGMRPWIGWPSAAGRPVARHTGGAWARRRALWAPGCPCLQPRRGESTVGERGSRAHCKLEAASGLPACLAHIPAALCRQPVPPLARPALLPAHSPR